LNVVVVVNQNSSNSIALGNYYCERRNVPPDNVLRINWPGANTAWTTNDLQTNLVNPLLTMLAARQLTNQIDYLVLSMDIPFQTVNTNSFFNGTTSALFYGFRTDSQSQVNSYAASEQVFRNAKPAGAPGYSFLATMITSATLAQAKQIIDQGVASDSTFPRQPVLLAKSSDQVRNLRYVGFDNVLFNTALTSNYTVVRTNMDSPIGLSNLFGFQSGLYQFTISPNTFIPGAMADSLTSYAGIIFGYNDQTTLLAFTDAGACGSYGCVTEPTAAADKFPQPQNYFYQARGYSLAECYYQSLNMPYEGLIVGEPLAAPCAQPGSGTWLSVSNAVLTGNALLAVQFKAADSTRPLQQVDLFVDGKYLQTLTNIAPRAGNVLTVTLAGSNLNYTVPANGSMASIASNLNALINLPANTNRTHVVSSPHGDRLEFHANIATRPAPPLALHITATPGPPASGPSQSMATSSAGAGGALTAFLTASRNQFLNSPICGYRGCSMNGLIAVGSWVQATVTKTNGAIVRVAFTNQSSTATPLDIATQLVSIVNTTPALQGPDGTVAELATIGSFSAGSFMLRARAPGYPSAMTRVYLTASSGFAVSPTTDSALLDNLSDLLPRDHLYVAAGVTNLSVSFRLDTTTLADGFHELTAVAYEGSHVRTQTRIMLPVIVQNSSLSATQTLLDLPNPSPAQGTYHIQVNAGANPVSAIRLYSTGGQLNVISNQPNVTFTIDGTFLGPGLQPFYALVESPTGAKYRTQPAWIRLLP
jgi:uncharacterized protein (TIGR03790 family)